MIPYKKVIQINTVYGTGSTGKIVASLYNISSQNGITPLVAYGRSATPDKYGINGFLIGNKRDFYGHVLVNFVFGKSGFASKRRTRKFLNWLDAEKPDLLHLHNLHGFYIHVGMLFEYIKAHNIPVIWTLHDCWSFTGQCAHFDYANCHKWKAECENCPIFRSDYPYSIFRDNSKQNYALKRDAFTGVKNMTIVTPSNWLARLVKQSFLKEYPVEIIPNGIDLDVFKPAEEASLNAEVRANKNFYYQFKNSTDNSPKNAMQNTAPIPQTKCNQKILLGVANVWDKRKGLEYMLKLSDDFNETNGYQVVIIGLSKRQCRKISRKYGSRITAITRTANQHELAKWYSNAFAYINPTLQDNFPTTNLEALACGTPVITFNTGGSPEALTEKCGIVVPKDDYDALKNAIISLKDKNSSVCREQALKYDENSCFMKYVELYNSLP